MSRYILHSHHIAYVETRIVEQRVQSSIPYTSNRFFY